MTLFSFFGQVKTNTQRKLIYLEAEPLAIYLKPISWRNHKLEAQQELINICQGAKQYYLTSALKRIT